MRLHHKHISADFSRVGPVIVNMLLFQISSFENTVITSLFVTTLDPAKKDNMIKSNFTEMSGFSYLLMFPNYATHTPLTPVYGRQ